MLNNIHKTKNMSFNFFSITYICLWCILNTQAYSEEYKQDISRLIITSCKGADAKITVMIPNNTYHSKYSWETYIDSISSNTKLDGGHITPNGVFKTINYDNGPNGVHTIFLAIYDEAGKFINAKEACFVIAGNENRWLDPIVQYGGIIIGAIIGFLCSCGTIILQNILTNINRKKTITLNIYGKIANAGMLLYRNWESSTRPIVIPDIIQGRGLEVIWGNLKNPLKIHDICESLNVIYILWNRNEAKEDSKTQILNIINDIKLEIKNLEKHWSHRLAISTYDKILKKSK